METSTNVINTIAASAADTSLLGRVLSITGAPPMIYQNIWPRPTVVRSQPERVQVSTVTIAAANNTEYAFLAEQIIKTNDNLYPKSQVIRYTSDSSATDTEISTALKALFDLHGFQITTVATSATVITFTAIAGSPLFTLTNIENCTVDLTVQPVIAPSGTANLAITSVIAPDGTAATAIAGTTTVTVTTLAAHGLMVGDQVTIADVATMTINGAASGTFYVATVPTSTTFTLADCLGAGGANTGTITINTVNVVIINTLAAASLTAGDHVTIASIATMTVNGASSFTGRIRNAVSTTQFYIDQTTNNGSLNSGTITITPVAQESKNLATDLSLVTDITAGSTYTSFEFVFGQPISAQASYVERNAVLKHTVYIAEGSNLGNYPALYTRLNEEIDAYLPFSTDFDPESVSL